MSLVVMVYHKSGSFSAKSTFVAFKLTKIPKLMDGCILR
jgi:hypothetical protein